MAGLDYKKKEKGGEIVQRLLVSIRGPQEALAAIKGGAHIADVEYPASALGTPYPLNIMTVRNRMNRAGYKKIPVSTNIGEVPGVRASSCQAALGVATAGAAKSSAAWPNSVLSLQSISATRWLDRLRNSSRRKKSFPLSLSTKI